MPSNNRIVAGAAVIIAVLAVGTVYAVTRPTANSHGPDRTGPNRSAHPNVLLIMTDDQTLESLRVLDNVNRNIAQAGTTFSNYFISFPNCCPSRATYLTGQYAHNNGVQDNVAPAGGFRKLKSNETLPVWLQRAGYHTASVGKYLNGWGADGDLRPPAGWDHWFGLIDPTTYNYYGYSVSNDGKRQDYGNAPEDYQTDVLGTEVVRYINDRATSAQPWFLSWTPLAPHAQEHEAGVDSTPQQRLNFAGTFPTPAPKYKGTLANEQPPRTASYNQPDTSKLPKALRETPRLNAQREALIKQEYQQELESLQSVDEWVGKIFDVLTATGQVDNTVVVFTSDNGFYHGEHRLAFVKLYLYEPGVHVPLLIRGGPFPKGITSDAMAGNVDLAPTILRLAGATSPLELDGRNLAVVAQDPAKGAGRGMLLENYTKSGKARTQGIRTPRYKYLTNELNEEELYDLKSDPDEIDNRAADPAMASIKGQLAFRLAAAQQCKGAACEGADGKGG